MTLLERVARRLESAPDHAEDILRRVLDQKREQLRMEGSVRFPGVGRFVQTEDGIDFVPEDGLAGLIDVRHAGTGPIPLFGEKAVEESDSVPEEHFPAGEPSAGTPGGSSGAERESERPDEEFEGGEVEEEAFWETRSEDPLGEPAGSAYQDAPYEVLDGAEEGESGADEAEPGGSDAEGTARPPAGEPRTETDEQSGRRRPSAGARRSYASDRRRDSSRQTLAIVAGLLIVTGSALILYFLWTPGGVPEPTTPAGGGAVDTTMAAEPDTSDVETPATPEPTLPLDAPLRAEGTVDPSLGGATWVVGSFGDSTRSVSVMEEYRSGGYRTSVLPGGSGYRVAVGQFATEADAEATRGELPADVAESAWTLEL